MRNIIFWLVLSYIVLYWGTFWALGYEPTAYLVAAMVFGLASMVMITWFTTGVRAIREGGRDGEAVLAFSICIAALYGVTTRLSSVYRISMDNPDWMNSSALVLGQAVLLLIFFTGVLLAPETKGGSVPTRNFIWWGVAIFLAGCFVGGVLAITFAKDAPEMPKAGNMSSPLSIHCGPPKTVLVRSYCRAPPHAIGG